ncbi:choice-of-anchor M domain-containing protein [Jiangella sp. DSM 45060]|uniref:choice-of-anchor M domain-containing protein n=1 Tax=Jiangella sp. DSM 45060 TaxID=1798224 RepID=UPI00087C70F0|nr:choice-of-anchor M domain-containing protein [Jiangella sp. DSM 45060]SDT32311.1 surface-anchored protein [Jiangella sp. DSM 45060]
MHRSLLRNLAGVAGSATLLAVLPAAVPLAGAEPGPPPGTDERRVLTTEHVDALNVGYDGERLTVNSKISPPVEHVEVDDLVFQLSDLGRVAGLPEQYAEFIGADSAWLVMQTQQPDVLWAGWSTEELAAGVVDGDVVDVTLAGVRGPGDVEVFQTGSFGEPIRVFSSDEDHKTLRQSVNAHVHANWAFTQPGVYTLTFEVAATVGGEPVTSGPVDYTWVVGGDDGTLPAPASTTTTVAAPPDATAGDEVVLEATVATDTGGNAPPPPGGHVEFHDAGASLGRTGIVDGRAALPVVFDAPGEHEITATYTSQEPQFYAPSTAEPVIVTVGEDDGVPPATTVTVTGPGGAVAAGEEITLTATQDPPAGLTAYRWSTRAPGALDFQAVDGATTDTLTVTAAAADDGRQYRAALYTDDGTHVAVSVPYTLTVAEPPGQCEDPRTVLTDEHVDLLAPVLDDGDLDLRAKVGTAADHTFHDPADLVVQLKDPEAAVTVPAGAEYAFLGTAGDPLWMIPQTQNPAIVWAGWSTEELAPGALSGDAVELTLTGVTGPGEVEVFQTAGLGAAPTRIFSSADPLPPRTQSVGQHVHANWAFTQLGEYTLTFEVTAVLADGTDVSTGEVDYAVVVGDRECDPGDPGGEDGTESGENGADAGGHETGGHETGGGETGGEGTDAGTGGTGGGADGGTESGADGGADGGAGTAGGASGGDEGGTGPKPTTTPTGEVCVPRPARNPSPSGSSTPGANPSNPGGTSGDPVVLTNEHVDLLAPRLDGSGLDLRAKVGSATDHTFYDPGDVLVHVGPAAQSTVPSGDTYGFLGSAGSPLWLIPETQNPEVVWAGWSTEELAAGTLAGDAVELRLVGAEGPGTVEVFQTTGFGDISRIFSSEESLPARQQSVGQHVHANWAFSAAGSYTLTFEVSGALTGGGAATTGPVEYSFVVGELAGARNGAAMADGVVAPAVHDAAARIVPVDASPSATPTPTATPSATAPATTPAAGDDCDLASTGTSGTPALTVLGGLLVAAGAVATAAYWRDRRAVRG